MEKSVLAGSLTTAVPTSGFPKASNDEGGAEDRDQFSHYTAFKTPSEGAWKTVKPSIRFAFRPNSRGENRASHDQAFRFVQEISFVDVDRIYAKVDPDLFNRLQKLDQDASKPFSLDHGPLDPVHNKLLRRIPRADQDATELYRKAARSFRQNMQHSLQIVVFPPPEYEQSRGCYADIDIDLGNPKRDIAGFFIHLGEYLAEGKTNHVKLNKVLTKDPILKGHSHYTITEL